MDRRAVLGLGAGLAALMAAPARADDSFADSGESFALWPGTPPGGEGIHLTLKITERSKTPATVHDRAATQIGMPDLTLFRAANPDGSALLIAPGGGYGHVTFDKEGADVARVLGASGVTCFVLRYRLPGEGWANRADVPLQDAQRAIRLMRSGAAKFGIDPARTGILGFSSGGHVAGSLATRYGTKVYAPVDAADALDARPDFLGLGYPALSLMPSIANADSANALLGPGASAAMREAYSVERHVDAATPPSFLLQNADDRSVPIENSLAMFANLRAAKVPAELHMFESGGHGFGIADTIGKADAIWPRLFLNWGASHGFFRNIEL